MCGRAYHTYTDEELTLRYFNKKRSNLVPFKPNYNLAPTQTTPVVRLIDGKMTIDELRFGLIPGWSKDAKISSKLINARAETLSEKPSFRSAFKKRRCIVPLSGFFEWQRSENFKQPYAIYLKNDPIMSLAGIWEEWMSPDKELIFSFSIVTTQANEFMSNIHNRMPVILEPKSEEAWLNPENDDLNHLKSLLVPCASKLLEMHPVSTLVNSPRNNIPNILDLVSSKQAL